MAYKPKYFVDGMTLRELAEKLNFNREKVSHLYHKHGYRHFDQFANHPERKIIQVEGKTLSEIAKIVNRSVPVLRYWQIHYGFDKLQQFIDKDKSAKKGRYIDMAGQRYGNLTALRISDFRPENQTGLDWVVRCDCGKEFSAQGASIREGKITSCGCMARSKYPSIEGYSFSGIAALVGIDPETASRWYRKLGFRSLAEYRSRAKEVKKARRVK